MASKRDRAARGARAGEDDAAVDAALAGVPDPAAVVVVVGEEAEVRRLLDGRGDGAGARRVAEPVPLGQAAVALLTRHDDESAARLAAPLAEGSVRVLVLDGRGAPRVVDRAAPRT